MAKDPYRYFRIEAGEIVDTLSRGILALEAGVPSDAVAGDLERLLRASHTLKGAAGVVGHREISTLAHRLEELLVSWARPGDGARRAPADALLEIVDAIVAHLGSLGGGAAAPASSPGEPAAPDRPTPARNLGSVRVDLLDLDRLLASIGDVSSRVSSAREHVVSLARAEQAARRIDDWVAGAKRGGAPRGADRDELARTVELLRDELRAARDGLQGMVDGAERRAREALEEARGFRLLPAETLFTELARAARDAAGRDLPVTPGTAPRPAVELETTGGDLRLDAHVLGLLRDALLQLVRNAIAHAFEPPSERRQAGKPDAGRIAIGFELRGSRAVVTCRDDGRGIDLDAFRGALVAGGLPREQAQEMDADALVRSAMRRGASTRAAATELAGRGVGLQVVGEVVERLRGEICVRTEPERGTVFELDVPVTVVAAPMLVVAAGEVTVTIPLDAVTRTAFIAEDDVARSPEGDSLTDDGAAVRFADLGRLLRTSPVAPRRGGARTAVLLAAGGIRAAVGVDRVIGVAGEVVLPLPSGARSDALVVGASLDGKGEPRLALDPRLLVEAVVRAPGAPKSAPAPGPRPVLVVDDSLTSRMLEQSILEAAGYEVTTAASAEEGLEVARGRAFALFVVDVEMPGMDGFEFVARTRADPGLAVTPAVLLTSRGAPEDRRRGLAAGARAYIVKGELAQDDFLETVRRLTG